MQWRVPERDGKRYFRHPELPDDAESAGVLDEERADRLRALHGARLKADYYEDDVELAQVEQLVQAAQEVVAFALDRGDTDE